MIDSGDRHPPFTHSVSLFGTAPPHAAFKCKNYYRSHGEIRQTFFHQILSLQTFVIHGKHLGFVI